MVVECFKNNIKMTMRLALFHIFRRYYNLRKITPVAVFFNNLNNENTKVLYYKGYFDLFNNSSDSITKFCRTKFTKKTSKETQQDESDDDENEEFENEKDSKIIKANMNSLRADLVLKVGLGVARNKIETNFYESKIRVNGQKIAKKSVQLNLDDEIDIIRGYSITNPSHLQVSRVLILSATQKDDHLFVTLRRYRNLVIENYGGSNDYKSSQS